MLVTTEAERDLAVCRVAAHASRAGILVDRLPERFRPASPYRFEAAPNGRHPQDTASATWAGGMRGARDVIAGAP